MRQKIKKFLAVSLLAIMMTVGISVIGSAKALAAEPTTWSGTGVQSDPYIITNKEQLKQLANQINDDNTTEQYKGKHFKLSANIDLNNELWAPIGVGKRSNGGDMQFAGFFDGNGYIVSGLNVDGNYQSAGLFGYVREGRLLNQVHLKLETHQTQCVILL